MIKEISEKNLKQIHKTNNRLYNYVDVTLKIKKYIWSNIDVGDIKDRTVMKVQNTIPIIPTK